MVEVKAGWWKTRDGSRAFVQGPFPGVEAYPFVGIVDENDSEPLSWSADGIQYDDDDLDDNDLVEHLPGCTGWDWKEPTPGEGYEWVAVGDTLQEGDEYSVGDPGFADTAWRRTAKSGLKAEIAREYRRKIKPQFPKWYIHVNGFGCGTVFIRRDSFDRCTVVDRNVKQSARSWGIAFESSAMKGTYAEITEAEALKLISPAYPRYWTIDGRDDIAYAVQNCKGSAIDCVWTDGTHACNGCSHNSMTWHDITEADAFARVKKPPANYACCAEKPAESKPVPEKEYRILGHDEIIEAGDQFWMSDSWSRCQSSIGDTVCDHPFLQQIRREVKPVPVTPTYRLLCLGETIQTGDQVLEDDGVEWTDTELEGEKAGKGIAEGMTYRRRTN